jgi:acyl carrier protein
MKGKPRTALEKVQAAIGAVKRSIPASAIKPNASLVRDLGIDSLKFAELSLELEDAFGRPIYLGDILSEIEDPTSITVAQLAEHLERGD